MNKTSFDVFNAGIEVIFFDRFLFTSIHLIDNSISTKGYPCRQCLLEMAPRALSLREV